MDPYKILHLEPNCSTDEVTRAYFYIAKIYHPNKGGNEAEFLRFQNAYKQIIEQRKNPSTVSQANPTIHSRSISKSTNPGTPTPMAQISGWCARRSSMTYTMASIKG